MRDVKKLIKDLEFYAPFAHGGYTYPDTPTLILEAAKRLALAEEVINDLAGHDGAEGFSASTYKLLDEWHKDP